MFLQSEYFNKQIASEDNTGYNIVPKGYFTYRHMSDDSIFYFNINDIIDFGIVSTLYPVFTVNEGMNSRFLRYYLNENLIQKGDKVLVIIGPEGGFSEKEFEYFKQKNLPLITLGNLILKAETAVIVRLGDIIYEYQV